MCGRFTLTASTEQLAGLFDIDPASMPPLEPRYNIAPTQPVAAVRQDEAGERELSFLRWGLVPFWAKDPSIGSRMINARSETAAEKPSFRAAFKRRRCLVPADGFYEWRKLEGRKQPYLIQRTDGAPFAIAGLWERWTAPEGEEVETCTLLTTEANDFMRPLHDRMPVILDPADFGLWLDPEVEHAELVQPLMRPVASELLDAYPVSTHVNRPVHDDPECLVRVEV